MNQQDLKSFLEKNKKLIHSHNVKTILKKVYGKIKDSNLMILYDFLGEILIENPALQEGKNHSRFLKGYSDFIDKSKIPYEHVLKMEKYFIEKYCLLENEEILCSFLGGIRLKKTIFLNRVFITNSRIIVLAFIQKSGGGVYMPWAGFVFNMITAVESQIRKKLKSSIAKSIEGSVSVPVDKPYFGFQFPISHPTAITLPTCQKGKLKGRIKYVKFTSVTETGSFDLEIFQKSKNDSYRDEIFNKIAEILQKIQAQQ